LYIKPDLETLLGGLASSLSSEDMIEQRSVTGLSQVKQSAFWMMSSKQKVLGVNQCNKHKSFCHHLNVH